MIPGGGSGRWVTMPPMRRLIAVLLMIVLPLQVAWSAAHAVAAHAPGAALAGGVHFHDDHDDHDHRPAVPAAIDAGAAADADAPDDDRHGGHSHPVQSPLAAAPLTMPRLPAPDIPPAWLPARFTSHIPVLFDRPPLARA